MWWFASAPCRRKQEARILSPSLLADVVQRLVHVSAVHGQQPLLALHAARGQVELQHQIVRDAGGDASFFTLLVLGQPAALARLPAGAAEAGAQRPPVVRALRLLRILDASSLRLRSRLFLHLWELGYAGMGD